MGYANPSQSAQGIHTRLYSRAFIFESGGKRVVYVSADIGMVDQAIKTQVRQVCFGVDFDLLKRKENFLQHFLLDLNQ